MLANNFRTIKGSDATLSYQVLTTGRSRNSMRTFSFPELGFAS
jgi:hypothetical protein